MSRSLTSVMRDAVTSETVRPVLLADIEFQTGTIYVWTGVGALIWNGNTYSGLGQLCGATGARETTDLSANNIVVELNGIPAASIAAVLGEVTVGGEAALRLGALDLDTGLLLDEPVIL